MKILITAINKLLEADTAKNREKVKQCIKKAAQDGTFVLHLPALREYLQKNAKDDKGKHKPVVNEVRSWLNEATATPQVELSIQDAAVLTRQLRTQEPNIEFIKKFIKKILHGVTSLSLYNHGIGDLGTLVLAEALESNTTLTSLNLAANLITDLGAKALAKALKSNATLASLELQYNHIKAQGATKLAESLKCNTTLSYLDLSFNKLYIAPDDKLFRVPGAGVIALAESLKSNVALTFLNLRNNQIGASGAKAFAESLKSNASLTSLNLRENQVGNPGAKAFAQSLKSNVTLTFLDLSYNQIGDTGAKALIETLKSNFSLISLNLPSSSDISKKTDFYLRRNKDRLDKATKYLETSFVIDVTPEINLIAQLTEIIGDYLTPNDLTSECDMSPEAEDVVLQGTFETIRIAISSLLETDTRENRENAKKCIQVAAHDGTIGPHLPALREYLQKNAKDSKGKQKPVVNEIRSWFNQATPRVELSTANKKLLIEELHTEKPNMEFIRKTLRRLTLLPLNKSGISDSGIQILAEALKSNAILVSLDLSYNDIEESGAKHLAEALKSNTTLNSLDLSYNQIRDPGAEHLAESLESNTALTSLHLGGNEIGNPGTKALAKVLKSNASLTSLTLQFNQIGVTGVTELTKALQINASLTSLNLNYCQIGTPGAKQFAEVLKNNASLTFLNLSYCLIGNPGAQHLAESLKHNVTLTSFDLGNNQIGDPGAKALVDALKSNFSLISFNLNPDMNKKTEGYIRRNQDRLSKAAVYLRTSFAEDVTQATPLNSPLVNIIGSYLTPEDLTSECDITGSAELMSQLGLHKVSPCTSPRKRKRTFPHSKEVAEKEGLPKTSYLFLNLFG